MCITDSLCCTTETNAVNQLSAKIIYKKQKQKEYPYDLTKKTDSQT